MDDSFLMGKLNDVGELSNKVKRLIDTDVCMIFGQEMVETKGSGIMLEDERWSKFMFSELFTTKNARVLQRLE